MIRIFLAFVLSLGLFASVSSVNAATETPLGIDLGASGPVNPRGGEGHAGAAEPNRPVQMAHEGHNDVHGTGVIKAVDAAAHKVTMTHQPISQIGWPAMTMEFAVAPAVDLKALKPDTHIDFSMEQGKDGMYVIQSIKPHAGH